MRICLQGHHDKHNLSKCEVCGCATLLVCPTTLKPVKEPTENGVMVKCDATPRCITQQHRWMYVAPMKEIIIDCSTCMGRGFHPHPQNIDYEIECATCKGTGKVGSGSFHKKTNFQLDDISEVKSGEFEVFPFLHSG